MCSVGLFRFPLRTITLHRGILVARCRFRRRRIYRSGLRSHLDGLLECDEPVWERTMAAAGAERFLSTFIQLGARGFRFPQTTPALNRQGFAGLGQFREIH